jgi:hypothetical protein
MLYKSKVELTNMSSTSGNDAIVKIFALIIFAVLILLLWEEIVKLAIIAILFGGFVGFGWFVAKGKGH